MRERAGPDVGTRGDLEQRLDRQQPAGIACGRSREGSFHHSCGFLVSAGAYEDDGVRCHSVEGR